MVSPADSDPFTTPVDRDRAHLAIVIRNDAGTREIENTIMAQRNIVSLSVIVQKLREFDALRRRKDPLIPGGPAYAAGETAWILMRACAAEAKFNPPANAGPATVKALGMLPHALVATRADSAHIHDYLKNVASTWLSHNWQGRFTYARPISDDDTVIAVMNRHHASHDQLETVRELLQAGRAFAQRAVRDEDRTVRRGMPYSPWYTEYRIAIERPNDDQPAYATVPTLTPPASELVAWSRFGVDHARQLACIGVTPDHGSTTGLVIALIRSRMSGTSGPDGRYTASLAGLQDYMLDQRAPGAQREIARVFFDRVFDDELAITIAANATNRPPEAVAEFLNDVRLHLLGRHLRAITGIVQ